MKTESYTVLARMTIDCEVDIMAESLEDAISKARELKEGDFLEFKGGFNNSEGFEIMGLSK
uniref:Uncharacterized protein n=1 Tax=viral metagenome TaxID=1070528 RepID=A0A6M3IHH1_9ZZZZ